MGAKTYVSDDLVEGIAYTVTPDANDPNTIHLTRLSTYLIQSKKSSEKIQSFFYIRCV